MDASTAQALATTATDLATQYESGDMDEGTVALLDGDAGLEQDGFACWLNRDRNSIVVWAGNDLDPDMNAPAEVNVAVSK